MCAKSNLIYFIFYGRVLHMRRSKKWLIAALAAALAAGVLSGCSGSQGQSTAQAGSAESGSPQQADTGASGGQDKTAQSGKPAASEEFLSLGTSSSGGTFNTLGVALCQVWNASIPTTTFSAEVTAGSSENCLRVGRNEVQLAFSAASSAYEAVNGVGQFKGKKVEGIRAIANLYPAIIQFPVLKNSGINTIDDIKGKRINIGEAGSGSESQALNLLGSFGLSTDDFKVQRLSHSNASDALVDEKIDGYLISGSLGQSHQMKAMSSGKCKLADLGSDQELKKVTEELPYYYEYVIPAGSYPNQATDVKTVATGTLLIVNENVSDDLVYQITKELYENVDTLAQSQEIAKEIKLESGARVSGILLHPGAERYYREKGIIK